MPIISLKKSQKSGFTLVELLVIAPIVVLVIGTLVAAIVTVTGDSMAQMSRDSLTYDLNKAVEQIRTDMKITDSFLATNDIALTSVNGYNDDATAFTNVGTNGNMLILRTYTTTTDPNSTDMAFVYKANTPNSCNSSNFGQNTPLYANVVYFVKNNTLWRRVIATPTYTTDGCGTPWQQPSCSNGTTGTICKTTDQDLVDNITSFSINYYNYAGNGRSGSPLTQANLLINSTSRQIALTQADTAEITITASNTSAGNPVSKTVSFKATVLN